MNTDDSTPIGKLLAEETECENEIKFETNLTNFRHSQRQDFLSAWIVLLIFPDTAKSVKFFNKIISKTQLLIIFISKFISTLYIFWHKICPLFTNYFTDFCSGSGQESF